METDADLGSSHAGEQSGEEVSEAGVKSREEDLPRLG